MIRERKKDDGTTQGWQARVYGPTYEVEIKGDDGRGTGKMKIVRPRYEKQFKLKKKARDWEAEQKAKLGKGGAYVDPRNADRTFASLAADFKVKRFPALSPGTRERYDDVLDGYLLPHFGPMRLGSITRDKVRLFFGGQSARIVSGEVRPTTVHKILAILSAILTEAVEAGVIESNPCVGVRKQLPTAPDVEMMFLSEAEVFTLADAMPYPSYGLLVRTAAFTGLRAGELEALRVRDVDLLHGRLHVGRSVKIWRAGTPEFGPTKSKKPRIVPLTDALRAELTAHLAALPGGAPDALVFTSQGASNTLYRKNPQRAIHHTSFMGNHFRPAVKRVLPNRADYVNGAGLRFHDLRHTFASLLVARGAHMVAIQQLLGHASIVTTQRYAHLAPDAYDALIGGLGAVPLPAPAGPPTLRAVGD